MIIPWGFLIRLAMPWFLLGLVFVFGYSAGQAQEHRNCNKPTIEQPLKGK